MKTTRDILHGIRRQKLFLFVFCAFLSSVATAQYSSIRERFVMDDQTTVVKLENGLTVIVKPVHTAPVVCVRSFIRTGTLYEREYLGTGISHLLEHLVAMGAVHEMGEGLTDTTARKTSDAVEAIGGQSNAYTTLDHASYYISAAAGQAENCIRLVADWMARPAFSNDDFEREQGVVQRELEMWKDDPGRQLYQAHAANIYRFSAAGVPVIGYAAALQKLKYDDVKKYHARLYVPQNMLFCVVGDVEVQEVLEVAQDAFADFAPGRVPDFDVSEVWPITSVRRALVLNNKATETLERLSFQSIDLFDPDLYALDLLSYILTNGPASRLVQRLQLEKQLVTSINSSSWTPAWGRGVFSFDFGTAPEKADAAEKALIEELQELIRKGVTEKELQRAKRQKKADYIYSQQSVDAQAGTLGTDWLATGDITFSKRYTDQIQKVTAAQVQGAAKYYFAFDKMAVTRVSPGTAEEMFEEKAEEQVGGEQQTVMTTLPNGLRCVLKPEPGKGLVSMAFVSLGGILLEDEKNNGLGTAMTALSTRGAGDRSADDIAAFFDQAGGSLNGDCGNNSFYWIATVLSDSYKEAVEVFSDVIIRPTFPEDELARLKPLLLAAIERIDEDWQPQLQRFFRQNFFEQSPYKLLPTGQVEVVQNLNVEQLQDYHERTVHADSSVFCIFGDFDLEVAEALIRLHFSALPPGAVEVPVVGENLRPQIPDEGEQFVLETANEGAAAIVAVPGMEISNVHDVMSMNVLDTIISGYRLPSGWLHEELRGKQLVYTVHAYNWPGLLPGAFVTYAAGQPDNVGEIVAIIQKNLERASSYKPEPQEVEHAVNSILTAELLQNQSLENLALQAALNELYGLGYDFQDKMEERYKQLTPVDVQRVGQKYLKPPYSITVTTPNPNSFQQDKK